MCPVIWLVDFVWVTGNSSRTVIINEQKKKINRQWSKWFQRLIFHINLDQLHYKYNVYLLCESEKREHWLKLGFSFTKN